MFYRQQGSVTYLTAVIMLLICTLVTAYTMRDTVLATRLSANGLEAERVMAVADAGLADGLARLVDVPPSLPKDFSGVLPGQGAYHVHYGWRRETAPQVLDVVAEGRSLGAGASVRVVAESAVFSPWLPDLPPVPIISRGEVRVSNDVILSNDDPGADVIWSGGRAFVPVGLRSSVTDRDAGLRAIGAAGWLEATFARPSTQVRELVRWVGCTVCDLSTVSHASSMFGLQSGVGGPAGLWSSDPDRPAGPAVAVVEGDLELTRPLAFDGILIVTGSVVVDHPSVSIRGAVIAGVDIVLRAGSVIRERAAIRDLQRTGYFAPLSGSRHERFTPG